MFLGARNSRTFQLCLFVGLETLRIGLFSRTLVGIENGQYRYTRSGTSHVKQIKILGSWAHRTPDYTKFDIIACV